MANKRDFGQIDSGRVYEAISKAQNKKGQKVAASPAEQEQRKAALKTQGKKGCKAVRINMAFTPDNHEFIKVMATVTGRSMTEFTNLVVERYRQEHPEIFEDAKKIIDRL